MAVSTVTISEERNVLEQEFHLSCFKGNVESVRDALAKGVQVDCRDPKSGATACRFAAQQGHRDILQILVEHKADINIPNKPHEDENDGHWSPLMAAAHVENVDCVNLLIDAKANVNHAGIPSGNNCLTASGFNGRYKSIETILRRCPEIEIEHVDDKWAHYTAAMHAAQQGHLAVVQLLVSYGQNLEWKGTDGRDIVKVAEDFGQPHVANWLKQRAGTLQVIFSNSDFFNITQIPDAPFWTGYTAEINLPGVRTNVLIKIPVEDAAAYAWNELSLLKNLKRHPNMTSLFGVVTDFQFGDMPTTYGIVIAFTGETTPTGDLLDTDLKRATVALDIASAIKHVHDGGYILRDITLSSFQVGRVSDKEPPSAKPGEALQPTPDDQITAMLSEFELSCPKDKKETETTQHSSDSEEDAYMDVTEVEVTKDEIEQHGGIWIGNHPHWRHCAPESLERSQYNAASDIWMVGVTIWELIKQDQEPFKDEEKHSGLLEKLREKKHSLFDELGTDPLAEVVKSCCQFEADDRPSIDELISQIKDIKGRLEEMENVEKKAEEKETPKSEENDDEKTSSVVYSNYLKKLNSKGKKWQQRWFTLTSDGILRYYDKKTSQKANVEIDLTAADSCKKAQVPKSPTEHVFDVQTPERTWHLAAEKEEELNEWVDSIKTVLGKITKTDANSKTKLRSFFSAIEKGDIHEVKSMIDDGVDVDACLENEWSPVMEAVLQGHEDIVALLAEKNANLEHADAYQWVALSVAAAVNNVDMVKHLVKCGANVHTTLYPRPVELSFCAIAHANLKMTKMMVEAGISPTFASSGRLPMDSEDPDIKNYMKDAVFGPFKEKATMLISAAWKGQEDMVKTIASYGIDISWTDEFGKSALEYASEEGHIGIAKFLANVKPPPLAVTFYSFPELLGVKELSSGNFGATFRGVIKNPNGEETKIVCKVAKAGSSSDEWQELQILKNVPANQSVLGLTGLCMDFEYLGQTVPALIIPFMGGGSLRDLISKNKSCVKKGVLVKCGLGMATSLAHLHAHDYIHRDIALRNYLISSKDILHEDTFLVIADFGLSRHLDDDSFVNAPAELLPWRWCAPETLRYDGVSSRRTDIFMMGVTMWEMVGAKFSKLPFAQCRGAKAKVNLLKKCANMEMKLPLPFLSSQWGVPEPFVELVTQCCHFEPKMRLEATDCIAKLTAMKDLPEEEESSSDSSGDEGKHDDESSPKGAEYDTYAGTIEVEDYADQDEYTSEYLDVSEENEDAYQDVSDIPDEYADCDEVGDDDQPAEYAEYGGVDE